MDPDVITSEQRAELVRLLLEDGDGDFVEAVRLCGSLHGPKCPVCASLYPDAHRAVDARGPPSLGRHRTDEQAVPGMNGWGY